MPRFIVCLLVGGENVLEGSLGTIAPGADAPEIEREMERGDTMFCSPLVCERTEDPSVAYPVELTGVKSGGGSVEDGLAEYFPMIFFKA